MFKLLATSLMYIYYNLECLRFLYCIYDTENILNEQKGQIYLMLHDCCTQMHIIIYIYKRLQKGYLQTDRYVEWVISIKYVKKLM